ncbi:MAG: cytochrome c [Vicinamibacterales bacterium]
MKYTVPAVLALGVGGMFALTQVAPPDETMRYAQAMRDLRFVEDTLQRPGVSGQFATVVQVAESGREAFETVEAFWAGRGDAVAAEIAASGLEAVEAVLAAARNGDRSGVEAATAHVGATCTACHDIHRVRLPDGTSRIR